MIKRHQDLSYFLHFTLINFIPNPQQTLSINKKSLLNASIIRDFITPLFVSQQQIITSIDSPIKPFLYQGKISLSQKTLTFSIKLSDLNKNSTYFLKIFTIDSENKKQLSSFKFFMNKYVEAFKVQKKCYFEQIFFLKNGSRIQSQVYIETNRAALEYLLADIKSQKRKKRSLSIKKNRESKNSIQKQKNVFTIQKLHKQAQNEKNLRKQRQQNNQELTKTEVNKKKVRDTVQLFDQYDQTQKIQIQQQQKSKQQHNQKEQQQTSDNLKVQQSLFAHRKAGEKFYGLQMSKITQVLNSENHSDMSKTNILETFSRQRQNLRRTDFSQKMNINTDRILEAIDMSQPTASVISSILQENPSLHIDNQDKPFTEIDIKQPGTNQSSLTNSFYSFKSRSFIEADEDEISLVHSSELSVRTEVQMMKIKRNKYINLISIALACFIIFWLMVPTSNMYKLMQQRPKRIKKLKK